MRDVAIELPPLLERVRAGWPLRRRRRGARTEPAGGVHSSDWKGAPRVMLTLLRIGWINLKRDRVAQALTFLLPIVFFSIFASVFGGQGDEQTPRIRVAVVDEDGTRVQPPRHRRAGARSRSARADHDHRRGRRARARSRRRRAAREERRRPVAVVIPRGLGEGVRRAGLLRRRPESAGCSPIPAIRSRRMSSRACCRRS